MRRCISGLHVRSTDVLFGNSAKTWVKPYPELVKAIAAAVEGAALDLQRKASEHQILLSKEDREAQESRELAVHIAQVPPYHR